MSKRSRITLDQDPETAPEVDEQTEAGSTSEAGVEEAPGFEPPSAGSSDQVAAAPARVLNPGLIVKAVVVGLAFAALVLLWKRRRL